MNKSISPINFIGFKAPLHIYGDTFNGDKSIEKEEEDQKEVKLALSKMTKRNSKYKSKEQLTAK